MRRTLTKPQSKNVRPVLSQIYLIEAIPAYINQQQSSESYDRDAFLEEYIASVGYTIGSYVKEKDEKVALSKAKDMCEKLLANLTIEDYSVKAIRE